MNHRKGSSILLIFRGSNLTHLHIAKKILGDLFKSPNDTFYTTLSLCVEVILWFLVRSQHTTLASHPEDLSRSTKIATKRLRELCKCAINTIHRGNFNNRLQKTASALVDRADTKRRYEPQQERRLGGGKGFLAPSFVLLGVAFVSVVVISPSHILRSTSVSSNFSELPLLDHYSYNRC